MENNIRIGIIGCSTIAKNSTIPAIIKSNNCEIGFIGSRSVNKAEEWARIYDCEKFGTYNDVLNDEKVDAVYISTPVGNHEEWAIKSAKTGKHILCEKSSTYSFDSAKKMIQCCEENNVRIMEGFMYRFHPSHTKVLEYVNKGTIGKLFSFSGRYGFPPISKDNIRYEKTLGGGILNDAGCYPIHASRMLYQAEPLGIMCDLLVDKEKDVDTKATIFMNFENERNSQCVVGYDLFYQSTYNLWGSKGFLSLTRAYNVPPDMHVSLDINSNKKNETISIQTADHFQIMIDSFCNELKNPKSSTYNFEEDLINQAKVMEAARISNHEKRYVKINEI